MTGHVQKRNGWWRVVIELGEEPAQRCPACRKRYWADDGAHKDCPTCHGPLEEIVARRQDMPADRYETKKLAEKALRKALTAREDGSYVAPDNVTVATYLRKSWLLTPDVLRLRSSTRQAYALHVERIAGHIGRLELQKLGRADVNLLAGRLATEKSARGKILSPASQRAVLVVLHCALAEAVRAGLIANNPATGVRLPTPGHREMHVWSRDQLTMFLAATAGDRLSPLWHLLSGTGLRRGEALGLHWQDIHLVGGTVSVQRARTQTGYKAEEGLTKTEKSRRSVRMRAETVAALKTWKAQQAAERLLWGKGWHDSGHVFTRENGEPWHPDRVTKLFDQAVKAAGLTGDQRIRLHDLRHTFATIAFGAGVPAKIVQGCLGHANISITMDTYSHVLPDMQENAVALMDAYMAGAGK